VAKKPETVFKERIWPQLRELPHSWWVKTNERSVSGIPDYLGCVGGRFVAIELKRGCLEADPLQTRILNKIKLAGGVAHVAYPENWAEVYEDIKKECYGPDRRKD
jgi:hypothetical protein